MDIQKLKEIDKVLESLNTEHIKEILLKKEFLSTLAGKDDYAGDSLTELGHEVERLLTDVRRLEYEKDQLRSDLRQIAEAVHEVIERLESNRFLDYTKKANVNTIKSKW